MLCLRVGELSCNSKTINQSDITIEPTEGKVVQMSGLQMDNPTRHGAIA